jgi:hypothetical protein
VGALWRDRSLQPDRGPLYDASHSPQLRSTHTGPTCLSVLPNRRPDRPSGAGYAETPFSQSNRRKEPSPTTRRTASCLVQHSTLVSGDGLGKDPAITTPEAPCLLYGKSYSFIPSHPYIDPPRWDTRLLHAPYASEERPPPKTPAQNHNPTVCREQNECNAARCQQGLT